MILDLFSLCVIVQRTLFNIPIDLERHQFIFSAHVNWSICLHCTKKCLMPPNTFEMVSFLIYFFRWITCTFKVKKKNLISDWIKNLINIVTVYFLSFLYNHNTLFFLVIRKHFIDAGYYLLFKNPGPGPDPLRNFEKEKAP